MQIEVWRVVINPLLPFERWEVVQKAFAKAKIHKWALSKPLRTGKIGGKDTLYFERLLKRQFENSSEIYCNVSV